MITQSSVRNFPIASASLLTHGLRETRSAVALRLIPEPRRITVGIITRKGKLSPAAEKFWQCAKEAASKK
jgi:hypothetical protein